MSPEQETRLPALPGDATGRIQAVLDSRGRRHRVVLERGRHVSGGLRLHSDTELHLAEGAELCFRPDYEAYVG